MATKSKFFRVATEGATTDGRQIERAWLEQIGRNFDPAKYGARIWMEHIRGLSPDSSFGAYGDVVAVKAEEVQLDGQKRMALFAQIEPLPELIALNKAKKKIYTSIEVNPKFGDSGEAYLVGLGVTDSPASLGTDVLAFAAQNPAANPFADRKTNPDHLFAAAVEAHLEFEDVEDAVPGKFGAALQGLREKIAKFSGKAGKQDAAIGDLVEAMGQLADGAGELAEQHSATAQGLDKLQKDFTKLEADHSSLKAKYDALDITDANHSQRPPATGGNAQQKTDC